MYIYINLKRNNNNVYETVTIGCPWAVLSRESGSWNNTGKEPKNPKSAQKYNQTPSFNRNSKAAARTYHFSDAKKPEKRQYQFACKNRKQITNFREIVLEY